MPLLPKCKNRQFGQFICPVLSCKRLFLSNQRFRRMLSSSRLTPILAEGQSCLVAVSRRIFLFVLTLFASGCATHRPASDYAIAAQNDSQYVGVPVDSAQPSTAPTTFGVGSTREEVAAIMGPPKSLHNFGSREMWCYGLYGTSYIDFQDGRVSGWNDSDNIFPLQMATPNGSSTTAPASPPVGTTQSPTGLAPQPQYRSPTTGTRYAPTTRAISPTYSTPTYDPITRRRSYTPAFTGGYSSSSYNHVGGYIKRDGTYVEPHYRTTKDSTRINNWSTSGNSNPFSGKKGYKSPF